MDSQAIGKFDARSIAAIIFAALCLSLSLTLGACGGIEDGGDLSVGSSVSEEGVADITYLGAIIEDTVAFGPTGVSTEYQSKDSTEYLRYVFDVTNEAGDESQVATLLPLRAAIVDPNASSEEDTADDTSSTQLTSPKYIAQDQQAYANQTIASRATDTVSVVFEITPDEAKTPEDIEANILLGNTEYTIPGSTIEDATPYQQLTADIAESFATLLTTTYQNACLNANTNMYPNPTGAFQGLQNAASTAAAEIKTDLEKLSATKSPESYEEGRSAFEGSLTMFEEYFSQVAAIDPSNPSACNATINQLNTSMESQLPQLQSDIQQACKAMPYLQLTDYDNMQYYFNSMLTYNVSYFEF